MSELNFFEKKLINTKLKEKSFSMGMYSFVMFIISYYSRVKKQIKIDFDSFIIVQVVTSHALYILNKTSFDFEYKEDALQFKLCFGGRLRTY